MERPGLDIRDEILRHGAVTFARFMELALYAPDCGYYERQREIGRRGDFFTSVSVGPIFGTLLAFQFTEWLEGTPAHDSGRWQVVEAGAHDGQLALDVLGWTREKRPEIFARVDYCIVEPSAARRAWQAERMRSHFENVTWVEDVGRLRAPGVRGIIFGNELLDAMPVHRLCWDAGGKIWQEWRVGWEGDKFVWQKGALSDEAMGALTEIPLEIKAVLPDGFVLELSPAATRWWERAAASLEHGKLLTLDYGSVGAEWLRPERLAGTLRAFRGQHIAPDLLQDPGQQDLTADVNFASVRAAGESAGLRTEVWTRQSKFLTEIFRNGASAAGFADWTGAQIRQFQTLTHPEHLGERFQVLAQGR